MKKTKFKTDRIVGFSAMLISLLTLVIFLYQTNMLRNQSRLSVRPRLTFSKHIDKTITLNEQDSAQSVMIKLRLSLRNNGLGPAIIEESLVEDKGEVYDLTDFFNSHYPRMSELGFFSQITDLTLGEAIPASESVDLFTYQYAESNEAELMGYLNVTEPYELPFSVAIEYLSMYEERWRVASNQEGHPVQLD